MKSTAPSLLLQHLDFLKLPHLARHHLDLARLCAERNWDHVEYLRRLVEGEYTERRQRVIERRVKAARFPVLKTLDQYQWDWPKKINRLQVQHLFRLEFIPAKANVVFLGTVGVGKTHLATALGYAACQEGHSVLFADAISVINDLAAAQKRGLLKRQLRRYLAPEVLLLDEIGYLPIDQHGADLLFQVISQRYERGSLIVTTNKPFKQWASIFNNDGTIASAVLDRLLHHAETVVIEGPSFRMRDRDPSTT
ncbi:MAG: IS21-like element helper ATPase IstB [Deltaproteobacteria bacterium]|nr:IS21-like element helper ATPase IstB [Deltaproteobacteria bacterium]